VSASKSVKLLVVWSILAHSAATGSRVAISLSGLELHASPFAIGMMLSLYSLLPMFVLVGVGRWVDQVGRRKPMLLGLGLASFGLTVPFILFDLGALFLGPVCVGLGFMMFFLCAQRISGEAQSDEQRKQNFSLVALGFSISGFVGPMTAGFLIDAIGHQLTFGVLAAFMLAALIGMSRYAFGPDLPTSAVASTGIEVPVAKKRPITDLFKTPELLRLYVCVSLICAAWDIHQFLVPIYGAQQGLSASKIGIVLGTFSAATFAVRIFLPFIANRLAEWPLILGAMFVSALVYSAYPWANSLERMLVLAFILGLGLGVVQPMVMTVMYKASPPDRLGEATGLRLTLVNASQTILPMGAGAFGTLGFAPVFLGLAFLLAGGVGFCIWSKRAEQLLRTFELPPASDNTKHVPMNESTAKKTAKDLNEDLLP
jgi:MFS family permease